MSIRVEFILDDLLHPPHKQIFTDPSRFVVAACGRRFGKTFVAVYKLLKAAYSTPNGIYYFISPTFSQSRDIVWDVLKDKAIPELVLKVNESRLEIVFINGSKIVLKSADRADNLRGVSLNGCVLDEVSTFRDFEDTWQKILRPALSDKMGWAWFISSPSGRNHFFDLYQNAKELDDWSSFQFTSIDGGYIPDAEIEAAKHDLDQRSFDQEYMATFLSKSGLVCPQFDRETHFETSFVLGDSEKLLLGCDLNVTRMPVAVCVQRGDIIIAFDEFMGDLDTPQLIKSIQNRYPDRDITIYPDASASGRATVGASRTNVTLFKDAFGSVKKRSKNPLIDDRINAFNAMIKSSDGTIRFKVTRNCKNLIESLEKHSYDEATGKPDKKTNYDHMYDAITYLAYWFSPLTKRVAKISNFRM